MKTIIRAEVIREKSFDPHYSLRVSYDDGINSFRDETVSVIREPPKVQIDYPESIKKIFDHIDIKKLEIEIMKVIVESLLGLRF